MHRDRADDPENRDARCGLGRFGPASVHADASPATNVHAAAADLPASLRAIAAPDVHPVAAARLLRANRNGLDAD